MFLITIFAFVFRLLSQQYLNDDNEQTIGCTTMLKTHEMKMTMALTGISCSFVCLTTPKMILEILEYLEYKNGIIVDFWNAFTFHLCQVHYACNAIFYFFLATDCRKELKSETFSLCCKTKL